MKRVWDMSIDEFVEYFDGHIRTLAWKRARSANGNSSSLDNWLAAEEEVLREYGWTPQVFRQKLAKEAFLNWRIRVNTDASGNADDDWISARRLAVYFNLFKKQPF